MYCSFSATVSTAFGVLSVASAGPIAARQVCGAAPAGIVAQTPLSQPTGITTAYDCAAQCKGNPAYLSFLFGLVNGVDKCVLYSVPAASLPPQVRLKPLFQHFLTRRGTIFPVRTSILTHEPHDRPGWLHMTLGAAPSQRLPLPRQIYLVIPK